MATIEPVRADVDRPGKIKRYSASLRLWHWLNTLIISGSLITVWINATITDDRQTSELMKTGLQRSGASVTDEQVRPVAHALSDSVWDVHKYFGYMLAGLLLFRLVLEFFQFADQKLIRKIKTAYGQMHGLQQQPRNARHEFTVKLLYAVFYLLLIIMAVTGLFLAFEDAMAPFKSIRHSVRDVHGFCMYLILAFIAVHLAGVILAERKDSKGIVSDMINGGAKEDNL